MKCKVPAFVFVTLIMALASAASSDKGVGPIREVKLEAKIDTKLSETGKGLFTTKCSACHKIGERYVGPGIKGITSRRTPEWVMNMILNPAEMLEKNEAAQDLLAEYLVPMTFQNVTKDEARAIYEYFRSEDSKK